MAVDMFFKLGDKIKGESVDAGKDGLDKPLKDQMEILAWSWSMSQMGTTHSGTGSGAGRANIGDIMMTKYVCLASNELIKALVSGDHIPTALLTARKAGGTAPVPYYTIEFEDVMVSSYSISGSDGSTDKMTESFGINFGRFRVTYKVQDAKGGVKSQSKAGWNIAENVTW
jgi:type VI secretion system secreted protein Hcp